MAKVRVVFPILKFANVTLQKLRIFWSIVNLIDIIRRFCDVTTVTWAFYDLVLKIDQLKNLKRL